MTREQFNRAMSECIGFGRIVSTSTGDSGSVESTVEGPQGEEPTPSTEAWGDAALLTNPPDDSECMYLQIGDERTIIATKNRGYQIEVAKGEVVVRAMGSASAAYVRLKPDGEVDIISNKVRVGTASATHGIPLGDLLIAAIKLITVPTAMGPSGVPLNAASFDATISTKHKVDA